MKTRRGNSQQGKLGCSPRKAVALREHLSKRLSAYALAAGAAGVGLFATSQAAFADIIYTQANIDLGGDVNIAMDNFHSDVRAFNGVIYATSCTRCVGGGSRVGLASARIVGDASNGGLALAGGNGQGPLPKGFKIGPLNSSPKSIDLFLWRSREVYTSRGGTRSSNSTGGFGAGYLGVKFALGSQVHYGWIAVQENNVKLQISGWAYNTIANEPIIAGETAVPEPATLGLLALGSLGLGLWRRKKQGKSQALEDKL